MSNRLAPCLMCGNPLVRLLSGTWVHRQERRVSCPVQQANGYRPIANPYFGPIRNDFYGISLAQIEKDDRRELLEMVENSRKYNDLSAPLGRGK